MKNLIIRTITGGIFVTAIMASAIWSPLVFAGLFLIVTAYGVWEFQRLVKKDIDLVSALPVLISGILIYFIITLYALSYIDVDYLWLILAVAVVHSSVMVFAGRREALTRMASDISSIAYVVMPLAILNLFLNPQAIPGYHTPWFLLGMFVILWTHDTFAYLTGSMFGHHPLNKEISPKKTWEGSIGGFGFAIIAAYIISVFSPELETWHWIIIALIVTVFGTIGDLAESLLKRRAGVKDSGNLLPGHGGILDRFDSVFFVSPLVYVLILLCSS